jgi:nicotinate-nucleotide--dimethylbenzimidazole phosphoribosyltransferase
MSFRTFQNKIQTGQIAWAVLLAAISALLVAASASAETVEVSAPPIAGESPAPAVEIETSAPTPVPVPVDAQEAASTVGSAAEGSPSLPPPPVPSTPDTPPSPASVNGVEPSPAAIVDSVSTAVNKVSGTAGVEPDVTAASVSEHPVTRLVEDIGRGSAQTAASIGQKAAESIAAATDRLPAVQVRPIPQPTELVDSVTAGTETAPLQAAGEQQGWAPHLPALPRGGSFSLRGTVASELLRAGQLAELGGLETGETRALSHPSDGRKSILPTADITNAAFTGSNAGHDFGSPTSPDVPLPAPGSPASAASGTGGSSFVPLVALLALLALAAPATLRRFREAADFRAPTRFVCALERPG